MPLFLCRNENCGHEWEGRNNVCDWCGSDSYTLELTSALERSIRDLMHGGTSDPNSYVDAEESLLQSYARHAIVEKTGDKFGYEIFRSQIRGLSPQERKDACNELLRELKYKKT